MGKRLLLKRNGLEYNFKTTNVSILNVFMFYLLVLGTFMIAWPEVRKRRRRKSDWLGIMAQL
jgi:hypothetical protein